MITLKNVMNTYMPFNMVLRTKVREAGKWLKSGFDYVVKKKPKKVEIDLEKEPEIIET